MKVIEVPDSVFSLIAFNGVLYSGSRNGTIQVWDLTTRSELYQLVGHSGGVNSLVVYNGVLYSGSDDDTI